MSVSCLQQWLSSHPKYGRKAAASHRLPIQVFEHMIDTLEKEDAISGTMPSDEQAKTAFHTRIQDFSKYAGGSSTNRLVTDVRQYWATKRQKLRRPLIRRFWPEVQTDANDPHVAFKPRTRVSLLVSCGSFRRGSLAPRPVCSPARHPCIISNVLPPRTSLWNVVCVLCMHDLPLACVDRAVLCSPVCISPDTACESTAKMTWKPTRK